MAGHPPDVVVLIDYGGSNLPLGNYICRQLKVPIIYYIAPQEWVWSQGQRVTQGIIEISDLLLAIFPQEAQYFAEKGAKVAWVGHPLVDALQGVPSRTEARSRFGISEEEWAIALFPASRRQEIKAILPVMLAAAQQIQAQRPPGSFLDTAGVGAISSTHYPGSRSCWHQGNVDDESTPDAGSGRFGHQQIRDG